jgi:multicomponent Na+:H+ antiporter subunit A
MAFPLALLLALVAPLLCLGVGAVRPRASAAAGVVLALGILGMLATAWARARGGPATAIDLPWAPTWNATLHLRLDGLAAPFVFLTSGLGALIVLYSSWYIPHHLKQGDRPPREEARFHALILAFLGAMILLATAEDLLVVFVALDFTALLSFFLIAWDREKQAARAAAVAALTLTAGTSLLFLVGAGLLHARFGTFSIPELRARLHEAGSAVDVTWPAVLIAVALLTKSAQFPLHFWLPRAMSAPTPVSAYLHSAAMVAAGVFVLQRLHFLYDGSPAARLLWWVGAASMAVGSGLALAKDRLKEVLAASTVAQFGYVVLLLAMGGEAGVAGAHVYVLIHGLCKSALFLSAGAIIETAGEDRLSKLGGLGRSAPLLALATGVAAAGLGGLPLTSGFFKDELFFKAAAHHGTWAALGAALGAALTLAYLGRFWFSLFTGPSRGKVERVPWQLGVPILLLAAAILLGGVWPWPWEAAAKAAGGVVLGHSIHVGLAYHFDLRPENLMALGAWTLGAGLAATRRAWHPKWAVTVGTLGRLLGPAGWYDRTTRAVQWASRRVYRLELRDTRERVFAILLPTPVLIAAALLFGGNIEWRAGELHWDHAPVTVALVAAALSALVTSRARSHLALILMLSCVGFALAAVFAYSGAPEVATIAVLIETTFTLLFVGVLSRLRPESLRRARAVSHPFHWRDVAAAFVAGLSAFAVSWASLSVYRDERVARELVEKTGQAHAADTVSAILADFRGLDTLGEVTVIGIALLGIARLTRRRRT